MMKHPINPELLEKRQAFINRLPVLFAEASELGLYITARALHNAVKASGWELAGELQKAGKYAPNFENK